MHTAFICWIHSGHHALPGAFLEGWQVLLEALTAGAQEPATFPVRRVGVGQTTRRGIKEVI